MKTRIIYTKFWHDNYISILNSKEKLLFLYLFTNEKVNICGIYELPDKYILLETGIKKRELDKIKQKFIEDGKFAFIDGWIKIMNFEAYNVFTGEKIEIAREKEFSIIPKKVLNFKYPIDEGIDRVSTNLDTLNNHKSIINNHKSIINNKIRYLDSVLLTEEEHQKLIEKLGKDKTEDMIERLDLYIGSKGAKYKNHYKTILNWIRMDKKQKEDWRTT